MTSRVHDELKRRLDPDARRYKSVHRSGGRNWTVWLYTQRVAGRLEVVGAEVVADPKKPAAITTTLMREIPWAKLADLARRQRLQELREFASRSDPDVARAARELLEESRGDMERRPRGRPPEHDLAKVAQVYALAWKRGERPRKAVAAALGISDSAASNVIARARGAHLLAPTRRGFASGPPEARTRTRKRGN